MLHTMQLRKLLRLITVVFLLANLSESAYSQVIDGKQYNIVNNWYNWRGGRFITNLNVPKVQATTGRDTGAIYYKIADSSLYVWTGSQWRQIAGGGTTIDTTSLSNRINLKLNISDTASMLSPYLRSNVAAANYQPIGSYATTSQVTAVQSNLDTTRTGIRTDLNGKAATSHTHTLSNITQSGATTGQVPKWNGSAWVPDTDNSGGGGGSADSSWVSSETGVAPNQLGYLVNSTLSALPSGWADVTPSASVTFSGKMIVSGGVTTTGSVTGNTSSGTAYLNRVDMGYYPYSKMRYAFTIVPQDKTSTSEGFALHFKINALNFSSAMRIRFNLTNTADSGKISMDYDFGSTLATSGNLSHSAGDTLDVQVVRDMWFIVASMYNRRTGKYVDCRLYASGANFGTGGMAYLGLLGGEQHWLSAKVQVYDLKDGNAITFIGDSQTSGSGASDESKIFPLQVMRGNKLKTSNLANGSLTLDAAVTSHVPAAILLNNPVIINLGYNDRRDLTNDTTTFKTRLDAVVDPLIAAGLPVYITTLVPTTATSSNANFDIAIRNYCSANGITVINIDSALRYTTTDTRLKPNYASNDAVHWSDSGQLVGANKVIATIGNVIQPFFKDTTSPVKFYGIPTGERNMNALVMDKEGNVKQVPQTTFDGIYNARNYNGAGTIAQPAEAHITGVYKTDSAVFIHNSIGAYINFNGGTNTSAGTTGSNILFTNAGVGGIGYPAFRNSITGNKNIWFNAVSLKTGSAGSITGSENLLFGANIANGITLSGSMNTVINSDKATFGSGSANIGIGPSSLSGITTGSYNIHLLTGSLSYSSVFSSSLSNTVMIGDVVKTGQRPVSGDIVFTSPAGATTQFWMGGTSNAGDVYMNIPTRFSESNATGRDLYQNAGIGTGTAEPGIIYFRHSTPVASGTTLHSAFTNTLSLFRTKVVVGPRRFQTSTGANVASANDLTLGNDGNVFTITGTTQINAITTTNWQAGSEIVLIFNDAVTVKNNTAGGANTAVMLLAGGVDFSATSNDVLKLVYNGTSWFEVSRSVN